MRIAFTAPILAFAAFAGAILSPVAAQQASTPRVETRAFLQRVVGTLPGEKPSSACFVRTYDAAHLAAHPQQNVKQALFLFRATEIREDDTVDYSFVAGFRVRGKVGRLDTSGNCGHARAEGEGPITHLRCGVDCDGGGVNVEVVEGNKSLLVRINDYISVEPAANKKLDNEPPEREGLRTGADDKVFRLDRVAIEQCATLFDKKKDFVDFITAK